MGKKYYSLKEIKTKFRKYRELKVSNITDDEYDIFCDAIQVLPGEIVDRVLTEIQFVPLSADPTKGNPACYVNLREGIDKGKEAIIVLTPFIFAPFSDKNGNIKGPDNIERPYILHEIAHDILGHYVYKDQRDYEEKDRAAQEKVIKWIKQYAQRIDMKEK